MLAQIIYQLYHGITNFPVKKKAKSAQGFYGYRTGKRKVDNSIERVIEPAVHG